MNYAELRAIAEAALDLNLPLEVETLTDERLADHIATFNPEFVLGLLDKLKRYEAALDRIVAFQRGDEKYTAIRMREIACAALNPTEAQDA